MAKLVSLLVLLFLLTGCTYESAPVGFEDPAEAENKLAEAVPFEDAEPLLEEAVKMTQLEEAFEQHEKVENYWFQGYIRNDIGKRTTTSMFNGAVYPPHGYLVNGRLTAEPFRYYRWDDKVYINQNDNWYRANNDPIPFDPMNGFLEWRPFLDQAQQLPDEEVLSVPSYVMNISLTGDEWVTHDGVALFEEARGLVSTNEELLQVLKQTTVDMTIWIGKEDKRIHQYQTSIEMPMPGAGYMQQEQFFRMYKFNDPGLEVKRPEDVEKYVVE